MSKVIRQECVVICCLSDIVLGSSVHTYIRAFSSSTRTQCHMRFEGLCPQLLHIFNGKKEIKTLYMVLPRNSEWWLFFHKGGHVYNAHYIVLKNIDWSEKVSTG